MTTHASPDHHAGAHHPAVPSAPSALYAASPQPLQGPSAAPSFPAQLTIDLAAIRDNVRSLVAHAPTAQVMAVVKADAYGHGLVPSALAALAGGATWLGVAQTTEALELRRAGVGARVLTWLYAPGAPFAELINADIDIWVSTRWALQELAAAARETGRTARVHLKIDTGLGRNGITPADLDGVVGQVLEAQADGLINVVGIGSHFAFADEPDHPTVRHQLQVFTQAIAATEARGLRFEVRHIANSAATLTNPAAHFDLVRPGLAVYGLSPVPQLGGPSDYGLKPAMTLQARLASVKKVPAGQGVSYTHAYTTTQETWLGLVPLGYADGIPRHASGLTSASAAGVSSAEAGSAAARAAGASSAEVGSAEVGSAAASLRVGQLPGVGAPGGPVRVGDRVLRVAGRVCMDQFVLDLGPDATERPGDVVTLFGPGGGTGSNKPTAEDWAQAAGTISYEITTRIGTRIPRVYLGAQECGIDLQAINPTSGGEQ